MSAAGDCPAGRRVTIGVDVGGTKVLGVAVDPSGVVVAEGRMDTPRRPPGAPQVGAGLDRPGTEIAATVASLARTLGERAATAGSPAMGVGVPGMVDRDGTLTFSPHLPEAAGADVGGLLSSLLPGWRVAVANDANLAALAELSLGAARGVRQGLVVTLGTGIGGGVISDGAVASGARGFAGEIGHMVVDPSGPHCPCGRRGCWERFASAGGLLRLARRAAAAGELTEVVLLAGGDPERVQGEHVTTAARGGDPGALSVLEQLGWWVAFGLANLTAAFDPSLIVLGGGLAAAGELLVEPTRRAFATLVEGGRARPAVEIVAAELGERSGAVGGALLARSGDPIPSPGTESGA